MKHPIHLCALGAFLACGLPAQDQQDGVAASGLPDCLIGDSDNWAEMIRRLTDRNQDGVYDSGLGAGENEAYDYLRSGILGSSPHRDTIYRDIIESPFPGRAGWFYVCDGTTDSNEYDAKIKLFHDINGDGIVEEGTAEVVEALTESYMTARYGLAANDLELDGMATDGNAIYWISSAQNCEGVWRSVDLNDDGDFTDAVGGVDETTPALVEAAGDPVNGNNSLPIANCPNTDALGSDAYLNPSEIQRISFDPTTTAGSSATGRFLIEDENTNSILALEDKNDDGDFYDAGECYLFVMLSDAGRVTPDANPDAASMSIPSSRDVSTVVVDTSASPRVWYALSREAGVGNPNIVYRCVDNNTDGDCNDAGEVSVYLDVAQNDPVRPFVQIGYMNLLPGSSDLVVQGDAILPSGTQRDQLIRLHDDNLDGVIDNATEVTVIFQLPADRVLAAPCFFPTATVGPVPAGLPATYEWTDDAVCVTSAATTHKLRGGSNPFDFVPLLGNTLALHTYDALPSSMGALHIGHPYGAPIPLDAGTCNLTVDPFVAVGFTTDATGAWDVNVTSANDPGFAGISIHFQSVVVDMGVNAYNVTVSNTARVQFGTYSYIPPVHWP